jgi:AcrR family transcriptional regulator
LKSSSKKEIIYETATALFAQHGFHAIGIDRIISESNVAKMTLYKYFPSKEHLIESILIRRDEQLRASIIQSMDEATTPLAKIKSIFIWYEKWFEQPNFYGCMFIKASEEFSQDTPKIRQISQGHKQWLTDLVEELLITIGVVHPASLANFIMVTLDGLTVNANIFAYAGGMKLDASWAFVEDLILKSIEQ